MNREDGERRNIISFPENDVRAVEIPAERFQIRGDDGIISFSSDTEDLQLSNELRQSMQKIRSMILVTDVNVVLEDVWNDPLPLEAGVHHLEDLPEQERFRIDASVERENLEPKDAQIYLALFNSRNLPKLSNQLSNRGSLSKEKEITSGEWETVISRNGFAHEKTRFKLENLEESAESLEWRIRTKDAGFTRTEPLNDAGEKRLELEQGESDSFFIEVASEYQELQVKSGDATVQASFTGV